MKSDSWRLYPQVVRGNLLVFISGGRVCGVGVPILWVVQHFSLGFSNQAGLLGVALLQRHAHYPLEKTGRTHVNQLTAPPQMIGNFCVIMRLYYLKKVTSKL